jgi:hypothetical protein
MDASPKHQRATCIFDCPASDKEKAACKESNAVENKQELTRVQGEKMTM